MDQDVTQGSEFTDAAVADALARTAELDDVPVAEHVARFDAVHVALSDALSAIDGA